MQANRDEILDAALQLSEPDRWLLVARLSESLPDDLPGLSEDDPGFLEELERRSGDWDESVSWTDLRNEPRPQP